MLKEYVQYGYESRWKTRWVDNSYDVTRQLLDIRKDFLGLLN